MADAPDLTSEVASFERALRRGAGDRAAGAGDPSLAELQRSIELRRRKRMGLGGGSSAGLAPPGAPASLGPTAAPVPSPGPVSPVDDGSAVGAPPGRVAGIVHCTSTVRIFRIGKPEGFTFRPGQYLKLGVPGGKREDFSIASAPHHDHFELAIELREGGKVTPALFALSVGDAVDIGGSAKGGLRLDPNASSHLMVATVTGIAPLRSMVLDSLQRGSSAKFTILHGASYAPELCFHDELAALAARDERVTYIPTVSRPGEAANASWVGRTGRVDGLAKEIAARFDPGSTQVYAVGNTGMIEAVIRDLGGAGFKVSSESYGG